MVLVHYRAASGESLQAQSPCNDPVCPRAQGRQTPVVRILKCTKKELGVDYRSPVALQMRSALQALTGVLCLQRGEVH